MDVITCICGSDRNNTFKSSSDLLTGTFHIREVVKNTRYSPINNALKIIKTDSFIALMFHCPVDRNTMKNQE